MLLLAAAGACTVANIEVAVAVIDCVIVLTTMLLHCVSVATRMTVGETIELASTGAPRLLTA